MNATRALGDLVLANYGRPLKEGDRNVGGPFDVFGSAGPVGKHAERIVDSPTIIIGRKGSVGSVTYAPNGGWPIDTTFYLEWRDKVQGDWKYLFYSLCSANLNKLTITTSIPGLNRDRLLETRIYFPELNEQRRIAAILDKAASIRKKRRDAINLTDEFLRSVFLDMTGDPATNPKGWPVTSLGDLALPNAYAIKAGPFGSALKKEMYVKDGYKIYGQEQVIRDDLSYGDYYIDEQKFRELASCRIEAGDLLISLVGTFGKISVVPDVFEPGIINPRLMKISLDPTKALPWFMKAMLTSDAMLRKITSLSHGGTMGIVNVGIMKSLSIPVPPVKIQKKFESILLRVQATAATQASACKEAESLFRSLQQRAFQGQL